MNNEFDTKSWEWIKRHIGLTIIITLLVIRFFSPYSDIVVYLIGIILFVIDDKWFKRIWHWLFDLFESKGETAK